MKEICAVVVYEYPNTVLLPPDDFVIPHPWAPARLGEGAPCAWSSWRDTMRILDDRRCAMVWSILCQEKE